MAGMINVSGSVNELYQQRIIQEMKMSMDSINLDENSIKESLIGASNVIRARPVKFEYLEEEERLQILISGVRKVQVSHPGKNRYNK